MPNDLLDAQAAVDWAIAQIPILQERFLAWQRNRPYELVVEPDPDPGYEILVAHQKRPVDPLVIDDAGAIINSARSSLDLLAATLAARNGVKPRPDASIRAALGGSGQAIRFRPDLGNAGRAIRRRLVTTASGVPSNSDSFGK